MIIGDFEVPGYDLKVTCRSRLSSRDASGDSNSTARTDKGVKAKVLIVSATVRFNNPEAITDLTNLSEQTDSNGKRAIHSITDKTANAMLVRQVQFAETLTVKPINKLKAWAVSFTLHEHLSVAELSEQKLKKDKPYVQADNESVVVSSEQQEASEQAQPAELSYVEKMLKRADDFLADD